MKKIFSLLAAVLFAGSMMAVEVTDVLTSQTTGVTGTSYTDWAGKTATSDAVYAGQSAASDNTIQLRSKNSNSGVITTTSGGKLVSVTVKFNSKTLAERELDIYASNSAYAAVTDLYDASKAGTKVATIGAAATAEKTYTFTDDYSFIAFRSKADALYLDSVIIVWETGGEAPAVATPVISGEAEFTESTTVTITCATEGAVLYYTLDGTEPNNNATAYNAPFNLTETATVKAIAYNQSGDQTSAVASKTFTKKEPLVAISCAEVYSKAKNDEIALNNVVVTYVNGKNVYVKDESGAMLLYLPSNSAWVAGDTLAGVEGKLDIYNGLYEVKPTAAQVTAVAATHGEAPAAIEFATVPVAADMNKYIVMKDVKVDTITFRSNKNINATIGDQTFVLRNNFNANMTFDTAKVYDITGAVAVYNSTVQVYFIKAETEGGETPVVPGDTILPEVLNVAEAISAADGQLIKANDTIEVRGVVTKLEFKGTNFKRYGSVNVYVADATGAEGSFEFYNCYSLEADTFRTSSPAYDPNGSNYEYFTLVTDGNNVSLWIGDTVKAIGKYNKYNTTYQLNTGCYLTEIIAGPRVEPDPAVDPDPIEGAITVAKAIELVNAMGDGKTSTHEFTVEGYVVNAEEFSWASTSQLFFLADDAENSGNQVFEAYYCTGMENGQPIALINGDKVQLTGHLQKYVKDAAVTPEISNAIAEVIEKAAGERPAKPTAQEITVAQALTIGAGVEHNKLTDEYYSITGYITKFVDLNKDYSFWMADAADGGSDKETAFEVYKPVFDGTLQVGDKVNIFTRIKNYSQTIESETGVKVTVVEALQIDTVNVATAVDLALELEDNAESIKDYVVMGYVANIDAPYSSQYGNITFYMSDDATATYGDLKIYHGSISAEEGTALAHGDRVMVVGKLYNNFYNDQNSAQIKNGKVSVMWKQAIEHIVLTEKVDKVIMDGVLYIVRDGKLYNIQGAQVR